MDSPAPVPAKTSKHPPYWVVWSRAIIGLWSGLRGVAALVLLMPAVVSGQAVVTQNPYKVQAAYLRNFAHYVTWPPQVFPGNNTAWHICIIGPDPFGKILEATFEGRTEQGLPFDVFRADSLEDLPNCQIVFIAFKDAKRRRAVLRALKESPVLTVSEAKGFLNEGGVIAFEVGERVSMDINLDQAKRVKLTIQTKMLEVSRSILENGVLRQVRWR